MIVCDLTHAYHPASGGIRTYVDAKRRYILDHTDHTHVLVIPGEEDRVERGERWATYRIKSPFIPGSAPYRFFLRRGALAEAVQEAQPDVIELNTYYLWPEARVAFHYRDRARTGGAAPLVSVQFHTDFARSYAGAYSAKVVGRRVSAPIERGAEHYVRRILARCDLVFAFSEPQRQRLAVLGAPGAVLVPQGVDLEQFHPRHADPALRASLGVGPGERMLFYAGRFDSEKHVETLVAVLEALPAAPRTLLVMAGDGPLRPMLEAHAARDPRLVLVPFQSDKAALARLMASADVYVTAGPHEVYAFSVVEAQASGLPVVGVAAGGLMNLVPPRLGLLGPVDDAAAMAAHILTAAEGRVEMGAAARRHAEAMYSWTASFEAIFAHYTRATETGRG